MSELPYRPSRQRFYQDLSQCLFDFVVQLLPTPEELAVKEDVRKLLERLIRTIEPQSRLLSFGSTANGFSLRNSDMDLCCLIDSEERLSASDLVTMLGDLLERETKFTVKPLPHARIPIVKLSLAPSPGLPLGIACDIGFENRLALENTRLLMCYAMIDPTRVRTMVLFLKVWSKRRKINSPYQGTLSSYGFVLLVIYFLVHVKNPPVLPNLQQMPPLRKTSPDEFTVNGHNTWFFDDIDIIRQRWQSANTETVAELLVDFFRYYSRDFAYNTGVASIRAGLLRKESKGWQNHLTGPRYHDARERNRFCIEDPFETDFNVARCVTKDGLYLIRGELMRASRILAARPERAIVALAQLCEERKETPVPAPVPAFTPSGASKPVRISAASSSDANATITPEGATTSTTTTTTTTTPDPQMLAAPTPRAVSIPPQTPYTVGSSPGPVAVTGLSPKPRAFVPSRLGNEASTSSSSSPATAAAAIAATIGVPRHSPPEHMASKRLLLLMSGPDGEIEIDCDAVDAGLAIATASTEAREPERRHAPGSETASESSGASELAEEDAEEIDLRSVHSLDVGVLESPVDSSPPAMVDGLLQLQQQQQQQHEGERGRGRLVLPSYGGHHYYHHAGSGYGGHGGHGGGGGGLFPPQAMPPFESTRRSLSGPPSRAQNRLSWPLPLNLVNPLPSPAAVAAAASASASTSFASNSGSSSGGGRDVFYETRRPPQQQSAYPVSPLPSPSHQHHALHSHQAGPMPMSYPSPVHTPTPMPSSVFPRGGNGAQRHRNTPSTVTVKPPRMRSRGPVDAAESSGGEFGGGGSRSSSRLSMTRPISPASAAVPGVGEPYYRPSSSLSIDKRMIPLPPSPVPPPSPGTTAAFVSAKMAGLSLSSSPSSGVRYQQQQQQQQQQQLHSPHHLAHHAHHHYHNLTQQHHHLLIPHRRDTTGSTGSASPTASMYGSSSTTSESSVSASPPAPLSPAIKAGASSPPLSLPSSHSHESVGVGGGCGKIEVGQQVQQEQLRLQDGILGR